jgi:TPR repeat protein
MSKAFQNGIGVNKDPVEAYAWLELYAETIPIEGRVMLNQMALSLDTGSIQQAEAIVTECKNGQWPTISPRKIVDDDPRLKLEGITFGGKVTLATINGKTLEEGESANVSLKKNVLKITCIKIKEDSVLVLIDGEDKPRWLSLK